MSLTILKKLLNFCVLLRQGFGGQVLIYLFLIHTAFAAPITIMIDPADALREIDDFYERGLTLKCAEAIQKKLEQHYPHIRVILTRFPGESLEPLQNANFANRLAVDFYLSIHFYKEREAKPQLFLYHYVQNPCTDGWQKQTDELIFIPYDQAHKKNFAVTKNWATLLLTTLEKSFYAQQFDCKGLFGIPHKALVGIMAPAFCIEASLKTKDDWKVYVQPVVDAIRVIIENINQSNYDSW